MDRQLAHQLLDHLAPEQVTAVVHLMEVMLDPISRKLASAPVEDEPISDEEERSAAESRDWLKHNEAISMETVLADFGLTLADFERIGQTPLSPESDHSRP